MFYMGLSDAKPEREKNNTDPLLAAGLYLYRATKSQM